METGDKTSGDKTFSLWRLVEKLIMIAIVAFTGWMFKTVWTLQDRVTRVEINKQENVAQWAVLQQHADAIKEQDIKTEVAKRVLELYLDYKKLPTRPLVIPPNLPSPPPPIEERAVEEFRTQQMLRYEGKK